MLLVAGAEAIGEQGEHYDPLFAYGTAVGSFTHSEESGGDAVDIGPSGAGTSKGSPVASSSIGWSTSYSANESGPAIRADSGKNFPMERLETDAADEMFGATSAFGMTMTSWSPLVCCISFLTMVLLQVFVLKMRQLRRSRRVPLRGQRVS